MVGESEEQKKVSRKKLRSFGAGVIIRGVHSWLLLRVCEIGKVDLKHENSKLHCILLKSRNVLYNLCN